MHENMEARVSSSNENGIQPIKTAITPVCCWYKNQCNYNWRVYG